MAAKVDYDALAQALYPIGSEVKDAPIPVTLTSLEPQFRNNWIFLAEAYYERSDGTKHDARSVLIMPDGMLVLPITRAGKIILVKVLRPGVNRWCWEMPQERMDVGDSTIEAAAIRCAREEAGLVGEPTEVTLIISNASMPDRVSEMTYPVVVRGDFDFESRIDKGEVLDGCIAAFTIAEVKKMMLSGEIVCPCAISALAKYLWMQES